MNTATTIETNAIVSAQSTQASAQPNVSSTKERKLYHGAALRILNFLASGCNQVEAAKAAGVEESYVSQLLAEEDFKSQVAEKLAVAFKDASQIDENYQNLERVASERLVKLMEHEFSPDRLLRVAKFANEAKRKVAPNMQNGTVHANGNGAGPQVAVLVLPTFMLGETKREIVVNPNNEIVAVNGKELTTFNSKGLDELVAAKNKNKQQSLPVKANGSKSATKDPWSDL